VHFGIQNSEIENLRFSAVLVISVLYVSMRHAPKQFCRKPLSKYEVSRCLKCITFTRHFYGSCIAQCSFDKQQEVWTEIISHTSLLHLFLVLHMCCCCCCCCCCRRRRRGRCHCCCCCCCFIFMKKLWST